MTNKVKYCYNCGKKVNVTLSELHEGYCEHCGVLLNNQNSNVTVHINKASYQENYKKMLEIINNNNQISDARHKKYRHVWIYSMEIEKTFFTRTQTEYKIGFIYRKTDDPTPNKFYVEVYGKFFLPLMTSLCKDINSETSFSFEITLEDIDVDIFSTHKKNFLTDLIATFFVGSLIILFITSFILCGFILPNW